MLQKENYRGGCGYKYICGCGHNGLCFYISYHLFIYFVCGIIHVCTLIVSVVVSHEGVPFVVSLSCIFSVQEIWHNKHVHVNVYLTGNLYSLGSTQEYSETILFHAFDYSHLKAQAHTHWLTHLLHLKHTLINLPLAASHLTNPATLLVGS